MDSPGYDINTVPLRWREKRNVAVVQVVCLMIYWFSRIKRSQTKIPYSMMNSERERVREEIMGRIIGSETCHNIVRMGPQTFLNFCSLLERDGGLKATKQVSIEEQVAKTLYMLGHHAKNRVVQFWFLRSGETISRHFHRVLRSIIELEEKLLKQPDGAHIQAEILGSTRFYPYFKDCIGAIDGTHVRVKVSGEAATRYRGRKEYPTQNVLAACTFDLKFTYVLPGWEGIASDSRIIKDALSRDDKLIIPPGKYYLVDVGFMLRSGLITPYRGDRYHLKEYSTRNPPQNSRELFNHRHSSLRNAIERAFGVVKKRSPIMSSSREPTYGIKTQNSVILACCLVHNYLMSVEPDEQLIAEVDEELMNSNPTQQNINLDEDEAQGELVRGTIASAMWNDYESWFLKYNLPYEFEY